MREREREGSFSFSLPRLSFQRAGGVGERHAAGAGAPHCRQRAPPPPRLRQRHSIHASHRPYSQTRTGGRESARERERERERDFARLVETLARRAPLLATRAFHVHSGLANAKTCAWFLEPKSLLRRAQRFARDRAASAHSRTRLDRVSLSLSRARARQTRRDESVSVEESCATLSRRAPFAFRVKKASCVARRTTRREARALSLSLSLSSLCACQVLGEGGAAEV